MLTPENMATLTSIRKRLRVTKVVATRAVKTKQGDFFVGMSAAWDSHQDDAGGAGADLISGMEENETSSMSLQEAQLASLELGMRVDVAAVTNAMCGGAISEKEALQAIRRIRSNYMLKCEQHFAGSVKSAESGKTE